MSEFYVLLSSTASKDVFTENTSSNFSNIIPKELSLIDGWKVSLQAIYFEANFVNNLPKSIKSAIDHFVFCDLNSRPIKKVTLQANAYTTKLLYETLNTSFYGTYEKRLKIQFDTNENIINIKIRNCNFFILQEVCTWLKINIFGKAIANEGGKKYVKFTSNHEITTAIRTSSIIPECFPSEIKVQLMEMEQSLSSAGNHKNLSIIPFRTSNTPNYSFYHEVSQKEYFNFGSTNSQTLSVCLVDEANDELQLYSKQPTFIKLKFKRMEASSFILRLSSKDSTNLYETNNATSFRIQLPQTIIRQGVWEVAVSSINYPSKINAGSYMRYQDLWIDFIINNAKSDRVHLNEEMIINYASLETAITKHADKILGDGIFTFEIEEDFAVNYTSTIPLKLKLSPTLASILGHQQIINLLPNENLASGIADIDRCLPNAIALYCDFTNPIVAGGKYCQILKFFPLIGEEEERSITHNNTYESHHMDFVRVSSNNLQSLQFELRDGNGQIIEFTNTNAVTNVNLLFQKIQ
jgi:hypothetical protein